jgi:ribosomal protein S18 acetylase RimI-like enzyme
VHDLHAGGVIPIRVTEAAGGDIAGLCMLYQNPLPPFQDAAYIALITVAGSFRGQRVGDFLLSDALDVISRARQAQQAAMPMVWAMIAPANQSSHRLFERHGFLDVLPAGANQSPYDWRLRAPGLPV